MPLSLASCGPYLPSFDKIGRAVLLLLVAKPVVYAFFGLCFRYRVSTSRPLSISRIIAIAAVATMIGFAFIFSDTVSRLGGPFQEREVVRWQALIICRLVMWLWLGWQLAGIRDLRLVGWTFSAVAIDLAFDVSVAFAFEGSWRAFGTAVLLFAMFLAPLYIQGRRPSLKCRFLAAHFCRTCGYDRSGLGSGVCPECGTVQS